MKYTIGDTVRIKVCGFNGLVIAAISGEGAKPVYQVAYPDEHGSPMDRSFVEIELESPPDNEFGFGRKA